MSSTITPVKAKNLKLKQQEKLEPVDQNLNNSFDSRESVGEKEVIKSPGASTAAKKTKKVSKKKDTEQTSPQEQNAYKDIKESAIVEDASNKKDLKINLEVAQEGGETKEDKKKKKAKKVEEKQENKSSKENPEQAEKDKVGSKEKNAIPVEEGKIAENSEDIAKEANKKKIKTKKKAEEKAEKEDNEPVAVQQEEKAKKVVKVAKEKKEEANQQESGTQPQNNSEQAKSGRIVQKVEVTSSEKTESIEKTVPASVNKGDVVKEKKGSDAKVVLPEVKTKETTTVVKNVTKKVENIKEEKKIENEKITVPIQQKTSQEDTEAVKNVTKKAGIKDDKKTETQQKASQEESEVAKNNNKKPGNVKEEKKIESEKVIISPQPKTSQEDTKKTGNIKEEKKIENEKGTNPNQQKASQEETDSKRSKTKHTTSENMQNSNIIEPSQTKVSEIKPKETVEKKKIANQKQANPTPSTETQAFETSVKSPTKDVKPQVQKGQSIETRTGLENDNNKYKKLKASIKVLRKNTETVNNKKAVENAQSDKSQPIKKNEDNELKKLEINTRKARSPDSSRQPRSQRETIEKGSIKNKKGSKKDKSEKIRMRSFDATKTEKIDVEDSFETRNKMWMARKQEKLLEVEKKKEINRKDAQDCTFSPQLNKTGLKRQLSPQGIYERGLEWSEKVKSSVAAKGEEILQEVKKPNIIKNRVKSPAGPIYQGPRKSQVNFEGYVGPQFGFPKTLNVPAVSHEPLEFRNNLNEKIAEIKDIFDHLSSHVKVKAATMASFKVTCEQQDVVPQVTQVKHEEVKKVNRISSPQLKSNTAKIALPETQDPQKEIQKRISTLKETLNMKKDEKKAQEKAQVTKSQSLESNIEGKEVVIGEVENAEEILKMSKKQLEIRNNRYVVVEDKGSKSGKKDGEDKKMNSDAVKNK